MRSMDIDMLCRRSCRLSRSRLAFQGSLGVSWGISMLPSVEIYNSLLPRCDSMDLCNLHADFHPQSFLHVPIHPWMDLIDNMHVEFNVLFINRSSFT